jgi:LmbE family N-acetylglucosaminyl deacetylase
MGLRHTARALLERRLRRLRAFAPDDWLASALIIAPHPDDETLGCGGIICKKIAQGASVSFVFVTDGGASHRHGLGRETLCQMREDEAREAVRQLGGRAQDITFLRYPDCDAEKHKPLIAFDILRLLLRKKPQSIFVPHAKDPTSDHAAVHGATLEALRDYGLPVTVYEYPIWYWYHWPWVKLIGDLPGMWKTTTRQTVRTGAGFDTLFALNRCAYVADVLDTKRSALAAHKSQTRRPEGDPDWTTLSDLAGGEFVARLLSDYEVFCRYEVNA